MPQPNTTTATDSDACDYFRTTVTHLWSAWTGGLLTDKRAFANIRTALTELDEEHPGQLAPYFNAFRTTVAAATTDWEHGRADEEDAMVRVLGALLALDAAVEAGAGR